LRGFISFQLKQLFAGTITLIFLVAIPLRGFISFQLSEAVEEFAKARVAIPLRGFISFQLAPATGAAPVRRGAVSSNPLARIHLISTKRAGKLNKLKAEMKLVAIPLRGFISFQREPKC